ncbi:MAG TPA: hypothetical protein VG106_05400 [Vicinamibacterales bacterium]|nr:hypothetical protein [Vicinamibacterales bacterium]
MKRTWVGGLVLAIAIAGCGKSADEKKAEQAAQQAEETAKTAEQAAEQAAKGLEQMAKGLEAAMTGGQSGDVKPVDPVSFRELQALFPELDGWQKSKALGERMSSPFPFSQAEVTYTKGDSRLELKMVDSGFNQLLLTPYAMFLQAGYEKETADGYEKSTPVNGQPGWEKWNSENKDGELNAVVGKRFLVTIEGNQIEDTKVLHEIAGKIDMGKLAALK